MSSEAQMYRRELEVNGTSLSFETGKYAKQADGSVIVRMGDSVVLVTACASPNPREGIDFLPLTVDYKEYTYASGRIPGGFFKREGKPSEKEVLTSRVIDRPIRPLFPAGWRNESQIIALVLSADANYDPGRARAQRRLRRARPVEHPVAEDDRRRARWTRRRTVRHQPDLRAAAEEHVRPGDGGQQRRHRDGRGGRQGSLRRRHGAGPRGRPRRHQAHRRDDRRAGEGSRQAEARRREEGLRPGLLPRGGRESDDSSRRRDAHQRQARQLRLGRSGAERARGIDSRRRSAAQGRSESHLQRAQGKSAARRGAREGRPSRRPQVRSDSAHLVGGRRAAPRAWLRGIHPRRNAGARHRHAGHVGRPAEDRNGRGRGLPPVHAALQLPAVLGR